MRAEEQRSDSGRRSRAVVRRLIEPPEFRMAWVKSFSSELATFLRLFSFSSSTSPEFLSPPSSSSLLASVLAFRSVSETPPTRRLALFLLLVSVSVRATAKSLSFSCAVMFSVWGSGSAFRQSRREPSEFGSVSPHRIVAPEGQGRQ